MFTFQVHIARHFLVIDMHPLMAWQPIYNSNWHLISFLSKFLRNKLLRIHAFLMCAFTLLQYIQECIYFIVLSTIWLCKCPYKYFPIENSWNICAFVGFQKLALENWWENSTSLFQTAKKRRPDLKNDTKIVAAKTTRNVSVNKLNFYRSEVKGMSENRRLTDSSTIQHYVNWIYNLKLCYSNRTYVKILETQELENFPTLCERDL